MANTAWFLEGYLGDTKLMRRIRLTDFPFRIGRQEGLPLRLDTSGVSRNHAEFRIASDEGLTLCDLGSTNGTYVNRQRLTGEIVVHNGDILHFADQEFRLVAVAQEPEIDSNQTQIGINTLPEKLPQGARQFQQMLLANAVGTAFQPIFDKQERIVAYELLGRGAFPGLPTTPYSLFQIAESLDLEVSFSDLLRRRAVELAARLDPNGYYFFNIHPREAEQPDQLLARMTDMRRDFPDLRLVLEIHEAAVTSGPVIRRIRDHLRSLNIQLAYDDFGAGQARLIELTEVPPDYVKFDMALVRDIDTAPEAKRRMLILFQELLHDMGITSLAEGVETAAEAEVLRGIGVDLYQGFLFGKPNTNLDIKL
ncbi:EAL domain, c-di-GMP-specific phosphodiesterase class I (or its enzymatically inactive variant) [Allochromatium warmingii]|uniref:EAL domain, c-di-GMP-specific phosphodiesterase class I (Or its enzymatically inactive variant) n=1 Tax=Allochromatium warmingii TaxID=61595 RepID=A0A1H3HU44_ALLWA|nr:EAL domain-containing protein [Allochromatium warmingii]SDY18219.1 EAL domain, c-di-GMP-specific phosphodiesterase class I (or its enzymatically inactive variant) [Allochromatium warmingii]